MVLAKSGAPSANSYVTSIFLGNEDQVMEYSRRPVTFLKTRPGIFGHVKESVRDKHEKFTIAYRPVKGSNRGLLLRNSRGEK